MVRGCQVGAISIIRYGHYTMCYSCSQKHNSWSPVISRACASEISFQFLVAMLVDMFKISSIHFNDRVLRDLETLFSSTLALWFTF